MKKLMIAVAIVCTAVVSQAATITWGTGSTHLYVNPGTKAAEAMPEATGSMVLCILGTKADYSDATIVSTAKFATKNSKLGQANQTFTWSYADKEFGIDDGTVLNVMFKDADGKLNQFVDATSGDALTMSFTVSGISDPSQEDFYDKAWSFGDSLSGNFTIASVPEPTSGLLLLLGVAGLALRRRRA